MKRILGATLGALVLSVTLGSTAAQAGPATGSYSAGTQYGDTLRGQFRQNVDGSGYYWRSYGSSACTQATTGTPDFSWSDMNSNKNWNDVASWASDHNQCDTKLYQNTGFGGDTIGYLDFGTGGTSLSPYSFSNKTSSYKLS